MRQMLAADLLCFSRSSTRTLILIVVLVCTGLPGCHDDVTHRQRQTSPTPTAIPSESPSPAPTFIPPGGPTRPTSTPTPTPENRGSLTDSGIGTSSEYRVSEHYEINLSLGATAPAAELFSERSTYRIQDGSFERLDEGSQ